MDSISSKVSSRLRTALERPFLLHHSRPSAEWIPICVGVCGGILGAVGMTAIPGYPADNIMDAIAVGIVSGLASTGAHQIGKQLGE